MIIQAFISGVRFTDFSYSTNGTDFTSVSITNNYYSFKSYLAAISAALPNSWGIEYDQTLDRVKYTAGSGSLYITLDNVSQADLLGFSSVSTGEMTADTSGNAGPYGCCPIRKLHVSSPLPGVKPELATFRHNRSRSFSWGQGTRYQLKMVADYDDKERILSGPITAGKTRVGDWTASSVFSSSNLSGYLDGSFLNLSTVEVLQADYEGHLQFEGDFIAPSSAHNESEEVKDPFWGYTSRGYSLNYYALIEGLPYRFCEIDTGLPDTTRTVSATLIIDNSQKATSKVDRLKGLAAASGVTLGILDPSNSLGIFSKPTVEIQIESDVAYNATSITLAASTDSLPSSGTVFLGNEVLAYTGNTGSTGSPANTLTGVTRPYGPGYDYGTGTVQKYKTVTDKKKAWQGSQVSLYAQLVDAFGRAVDTAWGGSYTRNVGVFSLQGLPGYDGGVWVLDCEDLIRRFSRPVVAGAVGKVAPYEISGVFEPGGINPTDAAYTIVDNKNATIEAVYTFLYNGAQYEVVIDVDLSSVVGSRYASLLKSVQNALDFVNGTTDPNDIFTDVFGIEYLVGEISWFSVMPDNVRIENDGTFLIQTKTVYDYSDLAGLPNISGDLVFRPKAGELLPSWLPKASTMGIWVGNGDDLQTEHILDAITGLSATSQDFVIIEQPAKNPDTLGSFPDSGLAVLGGESNEDGQLFSYSGKTTLGEKTILTGIQRLEGNQTSSVKPGAEVVKAELIEGSAGTAIATVIESSGFATGARGTFDTLPKGYGYAIESQFFVNDATSGADVVTSLLGGPGSITNMRFVLTRGHSLDQMFGGLLTAFGLSLAWVRVGSYLKVGCVATTTAGQIEQYTITDTDLEAGASGSIRRIGTSPNVVQVKQSTSMLGAGGASFTYRIIEDVAARGTQSATLNLFGLDNSNFYTFAEMAVARLADGSFAQTAYELKVSGERDYLAGQLVRLNLTYPGLWDFQEETTGLTGLARILEVSRDLNRNSVTLVVLVNGPSKFEMLCPVAFVTNYNPAGPTLTVTDASIFKAGDAIRIEMPGVENGAGHSTFQETTVHSISSNDITLSAALTFTPNAYTVVTYVQDDNSDITEAHAGFTHVGDGGRYS